MPILSHPDPHNLTPPNDFHHQESLQDTRFPNATVAPTSLSYAADASNVGIDGTYQGPAGISEEDSRQQVIDVARAIAFTRAYLRGWLGREPTCQLIDDTIQNVGLVANVGGN